MVQEKTKSGNINNNDKYASERYNPSFPHCHKLALKFNGKNLTLTGGNKSYTYTAVSGRPKANGEFNYSISRQKISNVGPILEGTYWIRLDELWENAWYKFTSSETASLPLS